MHKILIAPTAFKGTLSPAAVANAIANGIRDAGKSDHLELIVVPLADGGDGTVESVQLATGGRIRTMPVIAHGSHKQSAQWLDLGDEALIELASACGLARLTDGLQPMTSDTFALGQVIKRVYELGFRKINIALGGSASTDCGTGALRALGAKFFNGEGVELPVVNGDTLSQIVRCDLRAILEISERCKLRVLTDVENPLFGPNGAAFVFAPQKGATDEQVARLDAGLQKFATVMERASGRALRNSPGAGAAGGAAFGLACALGATIERGFNWVSSLCRLKEKMAECQLIITAEGKLDSQSLQGKVIGELIRLSKPTGKEIWVVTATADSNSEFPGVSKIILAERTQGLCTQSDLSKSVENTFRLHNFFTSRT